MKKEKQKREIKPVEENEEVVEEINELIIKRTNNLKNYILYQIYLL